MPTPLENQNGSTLIFTLLILVLLSLLGIAASTTTNFELRLAASERDHQGALYAAEAGIAHVRALFGSNFGAVQSGIPVPLNIGPYEVSSRPTRLGSSNVWTIESTARIPGHVSAIVEILLEATPAGYSPSGYSAQEGGGAGKNYNSSDLKPVSGTKFQDLDL